VLPPPDADGLGLTRRRDGICQKNQYLVHRCSIRSATTECSLRKYRKQAERHFGSENGDDYERAKNDRLFFASLRFPIVLYIDGNDLRYTFVISQLEPRLTMPNEPVPMTKKTAFRQRQIRSFDEFGFSQLACGTQEKAVVQTWTRNPKSQTSGQETMNQSTSG
jgi:hypothetical protein